LGKRVAVFGLIDARIPDIRPCVSPCRIIIDRWPPSPRKSGFAGRRAHSGFSEVRQGRGCAKEGALMAGTVLVRRDLQLAKQKENRDLIAALLTVALP